MGREVGNSVGRSVWIVEETRVGPRVGVGREVGSAVGESVSTADGGVEDGFSDGKGVEGTVVVSIGAVADEGAKGSA